MTPALKNRNKKSYSLSYKVIPIAVLISIFAFLTLIGLVTFIGESIEVITALKATKVEQAALIEEILSKVQSLEGEISQLKIEAAQQQKIHGKMIESLVETTEDLTDSRDMLYLNFGFLALKLFKVI
jgi:cell division protein FtsB